MSISFAQNPVERVVAALRRQQPGGLYIPTEVIRDASEKYRLLATRIPVGAIQLQPPSQKDSSERRAAVLLEYFSRQNRVGANGADSTVHSDHRLNWSILAAAVYAKSPAPLQQLQNILVSFMQPVVLGNKRYKKQAADNSFGEDSHVVSLRQRMHPVNYKESVRSSANTSSHKISSGFGYIPRILPELVIRLAGHLMDPNGTQKLACRLLNDIHTYYDHPTNFEASSLSSRDLDGSSCSNAAERRGHLYDLQRYSSAYEAAALFHVATTSMDQNQESFKNNSRQSVPNGRVSKKKSKNGRVSAKLKDEAPYLEEDDNDGMDDVADDRSNAHPNAPDEEIPIVRSLRIEDLVEASTEFTYLEVKQVLPRVQTLAKKLSVLSKSSRSKKPLNDNGLSIAAAEVSLDGDSVSKKQKRNGVPDPFNDDHITKENTGADQVPSSRLSFAEWKESILTSVRTTTPAPVDAPINVILSLAADEVLRKYGLLEENLLSPQSTVDSAMT